jgi:hypothetical protein
MELIIRAYDLKLKHTFFQENRSISNPLIVELKSDGVSGFGEATSNPYYNTSVPIMIEDLNKIRNIIETSDGEHLKIFEKNAFLFKRGSICFMRFRYGIHFYARKKGKSYMTIELYYREQSINRLHNRDCFYRENGF